MTPSLIRSCRKKSRLLKIYKKTGSFSARKKYTTYRNVLKQAIKQEEKAYYEKLFDSKSNDIRQTWKIINSLLSKPSNDLKTSIFNIDGVLTNNKNIIVNSFNKFFTDIGPTLAKKIPVVKSDFKCESENFVRDTLALFPTNHHEVADVIRNIKASSSCGTDQIPVTVIKSVSNIISPILATLINHSFSMGVFPDALKIAKITPILKSGDQTLISNYRPISLLNSFAKIYEKVFLLKLNSFLSKHSIIYDSQFGFQKKKSTQHALSSFVD